MSGFVLPVRRSLTSRGHTPDCHCETRSGCIWPYEPEAQRCPKVTKMVGHRDEQGCQESKSKSETGGIVWNHDVGNFVGRHWALQENLHSLRCPHERVCIFFGHPSPQAWGSRRRSDQNGQNWPKRVRAAAGKLVLLGRQCPKPPKLGGTILFTMFLGGHRPCKMSVRVCAARPAEFDFPRTHTRLPL